MKKILFCLVALGLLCGSTAFAASYPEKPLQIVVAFKPGGGTDITARIFCDAFKKILPQPMLVTNIDGAGGLTGAAHVQRAKPDGYTLLFENPTNLTTGPMMVKGTPFSWKDFDPLCIPAMSETAFFAKKDSPYKNMKDVIDDIKARPGKVKYSVALNVFSHFIFMGIQQKVGKLEPMFVPTSGDKPRVVSVMGGHSDVSTAGFAAVDPYLKSGDLKALGMVSAERSPFAPDVPTLKEQGIDIVFDFYFTVLVPKGTPAEVKKTLTDAFKKATDMPEVQKALREQSVSPCWYDTAATVKLWTELSMYYESLAKENKLID